MELKYNFSRDGGGIIINESVDTIVVVRSIAPRSNDEILWIDTNNNNGEPLWAVVNVVEVTFVATLGLLLAATVTP